MKRKIDGKKLLDKLFDVHKTLIESRMYEQIYQGA